MSHKNKSAFVGPAFDVVSRSMQRKRGTRRTNPVGLVVAQLLFWLTLEQMSITSQFSITAKKKQSTSRNKRNHILFILFFEPAPRHHEVV